MARENNYQTQHLFEEKNNGLTFLRPVEGNLSSSPDELSSLRNKSPSEAVVNSKSNFSTLLSLLSLSGSLSGLAAAH